MQINPAMICPEVTKVFQYGKDFAKYKAYFLKEMTGSFIEQVLEEGYNIVAEGTFRTPETPIKTLNDMQQHGYQ